MMKTNEFFYGRNWLNKYTLTVLIFLMWLAFFDGKYNMLKQRKLTHKVEKLEIEKQTELDKLESARLEYEEIMTDQEKYAREKYFLSKEGEDVFIIDSK